MCPPRPSCHQIPVPRTIRHLHSRGQQLLGGTRTRGVGGPGGAMLGSVMGVCGGWCRFGRGGGCGVTGMRRIIIPPPPGTPLEPPNTSRPIGGGLPRVPPPPAAEWAGRGDPRGAERSRAEGAERSRREPSGAEESRAGPNSPESPVPSRRRRQYQTSARDAACPAATSDGKSDPVSSMGPEHGSARLGSRGRDTPAPAPPGP